MASPLGFSEAGRAYYHQTYLPTLAQVITPVDPWALTSEAEVARARAEGREREMSLTIGERNRDALVSCQLLAAFLDGQEPDAGTVAEIGYGAAKGLVCFGLRTDFRQAGEGGVSVNLQVESFIVQSGGYICQSLDELAGALASAARALAPARAA